MQVMRASSFSDIKDDWLKLFCKQQLSPFQSLPYIQLFSQHFNNSYNFYLLKIIGRNTTAAIAPFERIGDKVVLVGMKPVLGKEEITDYGDIIIDSKYFQDQLKYDEIWKTIISYFKESEIKEMQLDYIREDSQIWNMILKRKFSSSPNSTWLDNQVLNKVAVENFDLKPISNLADYVIRISVAEVAPWINLEQSWDAYLTKLPREERKELKRKLKRLETQNYQLVEQGEIKKEDFDEFVRLHRLSDSAKEKFMSEAMADFFWQVSQLSYSCWKTKLWFLEINGQKAATVMGFVSNDRLLMYNSGFDPQFAYYSVGLLSHALIMQKYMGGEYKVYDFMRGSERYKYDLGAKNNNLFQIIISM